MAEGNYETALRSFAAAWKEKPGSPAVSRDFTAALDALKGAGDEALLQGRPEEAGRRWAVTLRHLSHPAASAKPASFTKSELEADIGKVSAELMENGLVEYRRRNLEAAIALWRSILSFDPAHEDAARSLRTADQQLQNLKKLGNKR
jgi:tetratricopeptide (TPR) repeat protein